MEPRVFADDRGWFFEEFNEEKLFEAGIEVTFKLSNLSSSTKGTLRGLHFQWPRPQGKLVSVVEGEVWDVAVDIRKGSPSYGQWTAVVLSGDNKRQFWIPEGFAHGFVTLSDRAIFSYLCTDTYQPEFDHSLAWDDPDLAIDWPVSDVLLSKKDAGALRLREFTDDHLPQFASAN